VNLTLLLTVVLYLMSAGLLAARLRSREPTSDGVNGPALGLGIAAVLMHAWLLKVNLWQGQGLSLTLGHAISLLTWLSALLLCLLSLRRPVDSLGVVLFPLAALGGLLGALLPSGAGTLIEARWTVQLHIVLSVLAYSVLTLAAVQAMVLALQDRRLHRHRVGGWLRVLPPLQAMEQLLFELTAVGFFLLSLALLSGLFFVENLLAQHLVHKTFFSILAWLFYAILLWGHWRFGWRGKSATRGTLIGYLTLLLAYFGSKFVLEQLLGTHWA
jgi:ABC-type uncharacterized transport system permease subunit